MIHPKHRGAASPGRGGIHSGGYVVLNVGWTERTKYNLQTDSLIKDELAGKRLLRVVADRPALRTPFAYYVVYPEAAELPPKVALFRDWLLEQVRETGG